MCCRDCYTPVADQINFTENGAPDNNHHRVSNGFVTEKIENNSMLTNLNFVDPYRKRDNGNLVEETNGLSTA